MPSQLETPEAPPRAENLILAALSDADYAHLAPLLEPHPLRMRETLLEAGDLADFVYFPLSGVISVLTVLENGMMIEFATIGSEGTTGVPLFLGFGESNTALISQVPGVALRINRSNFLDCLVRLPSFATVLLRYSGLMLALVSQSAACNRAHHADARCARWLLMTHDQAGRDDFPITQEFLAQMLGVSRPSVALSAAALQRSNFVTYHRGQMHIVDRLGLELAACECYAVVRSHFARFAEAPLATAIELSVGAQSLNGADDHKANKETVELVAAQSRNGSNGHKSEWGKWPQIERGND